METEACIGDVWQIGDVARVQVTMPRLPCFKLGYKIGRPDILKVFLHSGFSGFYHRVLEEGDVAAGDDIRLLERDSRGVTVRQVLGLQRLGEGDPATCRRALEIERLPPSVRVDLEKRLTAML